MRGDFKGRTFRVTQVTYSPSHFGIRDQKSNESILGKQIDEQSIGWSSLVFEDP